MLDGTPVVRVPECQSVGCPVGIGENYQTVVNPALHVVRRACHEQIGTRCLTLQGNDYGVRIVVPKTGIDDVTAFCRGEQRDTCYAEDTIRDFRAEDGVVDFCGLMGMTPFSDALDGNLEGGRLGTGREVVVAEDVGDGGVEIGSEIDGAKGC